MLLVPIPWAHRVWALPFLTVLAPSERYYEHRVRAAKKLTDWAWQVLLQVRRWLPHRQIVAVADSTFAVISLLARVQRLVEPIILITRFRLSEIPIWGDAALHEPAPPRQPKQKGAPRKKGNRLPTLEQRLTDTKTRWRRVTIPNWYGEGQRVIEIASDLAVWYHSGLPPVRIRWVLIRDPQQKFKPQALLCTDPSIQPKQIVQWFVWHIPPLAFCAIAGLRWQLEVTLEEVRAHLGVETQRQWSDFAIARTTPALLGLFSLVTLLAHHLAHGTHVPMRQAAWYAKSAPTFSDALAVVRHGLWQNLLFPTSKRPRDKQKISLRQTRHLVSALCYTNG